jgi:hypothetical protein
VIATIPTKIQPTLLQGFYRDFCARELSQIKTAVLAVPGAEEGFGDLWAKFKADQAVTLFLRDEAGELAALSFYEIRVTPPSSAREFFIEAGIALHPSANKLAQLCLPQFEKFAAFFNCQFCTFRTARTGLVHVAQSLGWKLQAEMDGGEWVLRKTVGEVVL